VTSAPPSVAVHVEHVMYGLTSPPSKGGGVVSDYKERREGKAKRAVECMHCILHCTAVYAYVHTPCLVF
jgi:hypothetical protein